MIKMFQYNWQIRDEWLDWCQTVDHPSLIEKRQGGMGSILENLFHIVVVEYEWIGDLKTGVDSGSQFLFSDYNTLEKVITLSEALRPSVQQFVFNWTNDQENKLFTGKRQDGSQYQYDYGEILRHVIAHEIHHIGQLSVWARTIGKTPISANLIGRELL